ncbi:MAG: zf-TFIIB domain-containing protein [Proteobacteria bacterium]|nr:zf-TFIIB domain-containing protein [Pseudomonadota bacterium]
MKCPVCPDSTLHRTLTTQGVEIDRCPACQGVWLDRGEIFLFATKARSIAAKLERSLADQKPGDRLSPASGEAMTEIAYPGGPEINYCPKSGGLWFDADELKAMLGAEPGIRLTIDAAAASPIPQAGAPTAAAGAAGMMPLPNLALRSTATLAGL